MARTWLPGYSGHLANWHLVTWPVRPPHLGEGEHVAGELAVGDDGLDLVEGRDVLPPPLCQGSEQCIAKYLLPKPNVT